MNNEYRFVTVWRVAGSITEVKNILGEAADLPTWWPAVYLLVTKVRDGAAGGIGAVVDLHTTGRLPYTLRWTMTVTEPISDTGMALDAAGDLIGTGKWVFAQDGPEVELTYHWNVVATKPVIRRLTWLLKPVFAANHRWAMARGEESLRLELRRRRARDDEELDSIPPPPGPSSLPWSSPRVRVRERAVRG